jgi:uncharacterized protein
MRHAPVRTGPAHLVVLDRGEEVVASILAACQEHELDSALVSGIGAVKEVEIGAYDLDSRRYLVTRPGGTWELLSLLGNVALDAEDHRMLHAHVVLGDAEGRILGGHLFRATCAVTLELVLQEVFPAIRRAPDPDLGLSPWRP